MDWRLILIVVLMILSVLDLSATAYYVSKYRSWQENKPYKLIELNPLLVFLWTKLGFFVGMIVGSVVLLSLVYIIGRYSHWIIAVLLLLVLIYQMYNHYNNITLLHQLINQYPSGHLDPAIFGVVEGSNPI